MFWANVTCNITDKHESAELKMSKIVNSTVEDCIVLWPTYQNKGFVEHIKFSRRKVFVSCFIGSMHLQPWKLLEKSENDYQCSNVLFMMAGFSKKWCVKKPRS